VQSSGAAESDNAGAPIVHVVPHTSHRRGHGAAPENNVKITPDMFQKVKCNG